jgi:hypothetical protein
VLSLSWHLPFLSMAKGSAACRSQLDHGFDILRNMNLMALCASIICTTESTTITPRQHAWPGGLDDTVVLRPQLVGLLKSELEVIIFMSAPFTPSTHGQRSASRSTLSNQGPLVERSVFVSHERNNECASSRSNNLKSTGIIVVASCDINLCSFTPSHSIIVRNNVEPSQPLYGLKHTHNLVLSIDIEVRAARHASRPMAVAHMYKQHVHGLSSLRRVHALSPVSPLFFSLASLASLYPFGSEVLPATLSPWVDCVSSCPFPAVFVQTRSQHRHMGAIGSLRLSPEQMVTTRPQRHEKTDAMFHPRSSSYRGLDIAQRRPGADLIHIYIENASWILYT